VAVEQVRPRGGEGGPDGVERAGIAALGDIGDGDEHGGELSLLIPATGAPSGALAVPGTRTCKGY
jgi:hypothetical protein